MLDIDVTTILFQIINFIIFAVALYLLLFKGLIKKANKRKSEIESIQNEIKENHAESEKLRKSLEDEYKSIDQKIESMITEEKEKIAREKKKILEKAKDETQGIVIEAKKEAKKEQQKAYAEYNDELVNTIIEICRIMLVNATPQEVHDALIQQINDRIWDLGKKEMSRVETIRKSLEDREPTAHIISAKKISPELQAKIIRTLSALADRNVRMEINTDPSLGAGIRIRLGDLIIDNSYRTQLENLRENVVKELDDFLSAE